MGQKAKIKHALEPLRHLHKRSFAEWEADLLERKQPTRTPERT